MNKLYSRILEIKHLPRSIKILIIIGINWTFQSLLYMDKTEKYFKIFLDVILFIIFFFILEQFFNLYISIISAIIIAHTLNWIFNGHIFALMKTFGMVTTDPSTFINYIEKLKYRGSKEQSIKLIAVFGSISREELNKTSDIDVRVIRANGFFNGLRSSIFIMLERTKAFLNKFPLDIYILDDEKGIHGLKEEPIIIFNDGRGC